MSGRSVRFAQDVDRILYTPEIPFGQAVDKKARDPYRDGIHIALREPAVEFDLDSHFNPGLFRGSVLNAPATSPYVPSFIIISRSLPWKITVSRQAGEVLTVQDVLYGIMNSLQCPATNELAELRRTDWDRFRIVEGRRKRRVKKENLEESAPARRIDWLPSGERVFLGLSSEQGSVAGSTERILKVK